MPSKLIFALFVWTCCHKFCLGLFKKMYNFWNVLSKTIVQYYYHWERTVGPWRRPFAHVTWFAWRLVKITLGQFSDIGGRVDRSQSLFYFVPQSHSQAGSTTAKGIIGTGTHSTRAGLSDVTCKWLWHANESIRMDSVLGKWSEYSASTVGKFEA